MILCRRLALAVLVTVVLAACGGASAPTEKKADLFRIAIGVDPDTLDPIGQTTTTVQNIVDMVVETLVTIDEKGVVKPLLAESWQTSGDGLQLTLVLRKDVKFSDGAALDAQAVKLNLDRMLDPALRVPLRGILGDAIKSVEVVDPKTVRLALKQATAPLVAALSQTTAGILSPATIRTAPNTYKDVQKIVGTGPYTLKEFVKADHLTLTRNDTYWGRKAIYQTQEIKIVPEAASRESLVLAGQADMIILPPVADLAALQANSKVKVKLADSDRTIFIAINNLRPGPLQKPEVRQALNYAVDKKSIIKNVLFNAADPLDAPMAKSLFGYCPIGSYAYDPAKARSMLAAAGASDLQVKLISPQGRYIQDLEAAQAIAGNLRDAGVKVDGPTKSDWPGYVATITKAPGENTTQLHVLGWAPGYLDAQQQMEQFLSLRWPPKALATSFYKNPTVDTLIQKANAGTDANTRKQQYCDAAKQVWSDAPWIFLWTQRFPIVYSSKVKGVGSFPTEKFYTVYAEPA
jgi:peptide/nickel transport system substrate-binding protein